MPRTKSDMKVAIDVVHHLERWPLYEGGGDVQKGRREDRHRDYWLSARGDERHTEDENLFRESKSE